MLAVFLVLLCAFPYLSTASDETVNQWFTVAMPTIPCSESNEGETMDIPNREGIMWVCRNEIWETFWDVPSDDPGNDCPGMSCKDIRIEMQTSNTGMYWLNKTDSCMNETTDTIQVYCEMTLDGGGWTLVWKHSYMEVGTPLTEDMKYFSNFYKACEDVEAGWCNIPQKNSFCPMEMIIVAYHNKSIVYAYKGDFNLNLDKDWYGGILYNPVKVVDMCEWGNGIVPAPYIVLGLGGLAFDKLSPTNYRKNCDTYSGYLGNARDCRFENCRTHSNQQMTMAMYVR